MNTNPATPTTTAARPAHAFTPYTNASTIRHYDKVSVLAFHWENDNLQVVPLENELLHVFRDDYRFETSSFTIPARQGVISHSALLRHLMGHADGAAGPHTLRIYVYSGHSHDPGMTGRSWNLVGDLSPNRPAVDWWAIQCKLEMYAGSVCYIFDTCSVVSMVFKSYQGAELISASSWNTIAPAAHNTSFTRALIDTLLEMRHENSTLATVYSNLMRQIETNSDLSGLHQQAWHTKCHHRQYGLDRHAGRRDQSAARNRLRVLLSVNIDDINDPRALDMKFWRQWSPQVFPGMPPDSIKVEALYMGSLTYTNDIATTSQQFVIK
ncbi:hypothetical protein N7465_006484 [Penicillium sp. CMV-2018d]|nr:hypothetical protein N7465_006484 [Penicillium sp. CMV-2018d]